jgi:glucuronate isomerase
MPTVCFLPIRAAARRVDSAYLAKLVAEGRLRDWEAEELIVDLTYNLVRKAYKL